MTSNLLRIVYASAATTPFSSEELRALLDRARERNRQVDVGGLLIYLRGSFWQTLEGESSAVASTFARIEKDRRHNRVMMLLREEPEARIFGEWSMGFLDLEKAPRLSGFVLPNASTDGFLETGADPAAVRRILRGFLDGKWRRAIE
jgi:hypothetical protein